MAAHWARSLTKLYFTFTLARTERFALTGQLRFQCSQSPRRPRRTLPRALCLAGLHHPARWSRWLRSFLCQRQQRECDKAAQQQLDLPPTPVHLGHWAAEASQPASAEYLRFCSKEKCFDDDDDDAKEWSVRALAARDGHLPLLQELLIPILTQSNTDGIMYEVTDAAAHGGQLETLQWLKTQKGFKLDRENFSTAFQGGHLEVLKWLRSEGCPWVEESCTCNDAAQRGHWEVMKWRKSEGCPWDANTCAYAAQGGHLEMLKWLRSEGCPWNEESCDAAAEGGHLEVLKWLRSEGCPWDGLTCSWAAQGGHFEILKWLKSEGCPWYTGLICCDAARAGHFEMLKWLRSEGCSWDEDVSSWAAGNGHLDMVKYLHENGCPWDEVACLSSAEGGHLDVLKYLHENGCPWDGRAWRASAESTIEYLEENGCPQYFDFAELRRRRNERY